MEGRRSLGAAGSSRAPPGRGACDRDGHSQMAQPTAGGAGCGDRPGPIRGRGRDAGSRGVSWRPLALRTVFGARPPCREHSRAVCALPGRLDAACGRDGQQDSDLRRAHPEGPPMSSSNARVGRSCPTGTSRGPPRRPGRSQGTRGQAP